MNKNDDLEEILINKTSMDDLIKMKIETEFKKEITQKNQKKSPQIITEIKSVNAPEIKSLIIQLNCTNDEKTLSCASECLCISSLKSLFSSF